MIENEKEANDIRIVINTITMNETFSNRTSYFDSLRVFACLAVILLHVAGGEWYANEPSFEWHIMNLYDSMVRWCVPIFLMISGALFLNPNKRVSLRRLYTHNILRIVTAFACWSLVYAVYIYLTSESPNRIKDLVAHFFKGHFHMCFLWLIVGLYMLVPILRQITQSRKITEYFLLLSIVFCLVVPTLFDIVEFFVPTMQLPAKFLKEYYHGLHLQMLYGYTEYFVLGHYLHTVSFSRKTENLLILLGAISTLVIAVLTFAAFEIRGVPSETFYKYNSPFVLLEAAAVFLIAKRYLYNSSTKWISILSKFTFGIYLVHMLVLAILVSYGYTPTTINPIIGIPLMSLLIFIVSAVIIAVLNRIPVINKWVM